MKIIVNYIVWWEETLDYFTQRLGRKAQMISNNCVRHRLRIFTLTMHSMALILELLQLPQKKWPRKKKKDGINWWGVHVSCWWLIVSCVSWLYYSFSPFKWAPHASPLLSAWPLSIALCCVFLFFFFLLKCQSHQLI